MDRSVISENFPIVKPNKITHRMYTVEVVVIAPRVPLGIDLPASAKSPDLFDPAIIPVQEGKKIPTRIAFCVQIISSWLLKLVQKISERSYTSGYIGSNPQFSTCFFINHFMCGSIVQ